MYINMMLLIPDCWTGIYFSGDGAHRNEQGYYNITGRMDDVINISGHRLGTAEIEDAMVGNVYYMQELVKMVVWTSKDI